MFFGCDLLALYLIPNEIFNFFLEDLSKVVDEVSDMVPGIQRSTRNNDSWADALVYDLPAYTPPYGPGRQNYKKSRHAGYIKCAQ
jgi:hypothetical protein